MSDGLDNSKYSDTDDGQTWEISPFVVFGLCGFTLYLVWVFMIYASPILAPENILQTLGLGVAGTDSPNSTRYIIRLAQMTSLLVTLVIAWRCSNALSKKRSVILMLAGSLVLNTLGVLTLLVFSNNVLIYTSSLAILLPISIAVLMGVSQGFMILLWSSFLCNIGEHRILLFAAISVGCAATLTLLMSFLLPIAATLITLSIAWLSLGCFTFIHYRQGERPKTLLVKAKASDKRFSIHIKSTVSVILYSMVIGFAVCFIASSGAGLFGVAAAGVAVIVASAVVALDTVRYQKITESLLAKLHMPVMIIGMAPMFFDNLIAQILGCALLLCFFMVIFIVNLTALAEHVRIDHLNSIRVFGFGRAGNALGFLIGGLFCFLAFHAPLGELLGNQGFSWTTAILLVLLAIFVIGSSFIFEDHYPMNRNARQTAKPTLLPEEHRLPSSDLHTLSTYMLESDEYLQSANRGIWSKRVKVLSLLYELSPKETEVLFLLAKGRNAEYIQNELVVSRHTAKAHIYHIYQKTGVHSRQDLINMLENVEVAND
ncbi:hypothetical protein FACS1894104_2900 [Actinomycetota bacterium]|nr:hypothetical protein FACS1894104_2900 [Actinomycetota bacterium]